MVSYLDFINEYIMGSVQMLVGFRFLVRFLGKKARFFHYLLFAAAGVALIRLVQGGRIAEFLAYALLLVAAGIFACHADWEPVILYSALTVEIMQFSFGIVNSLLAIFYPWMSSFQYKAVGLAFMVLGYLALLLSAFCYCMVQRFFPHLGTVRKQYMPVMLVPLLLIFLMGEYINAVLFENPGILYGGSAANASHLKMLVIQVLGLASLFCIMFAYEKLLENSRLSMELSLLEQEEYFLNQYVEESRARYDNTKSFRHDIKSHVTVVKELLQVGKPEQALSYIMDMEEIAEGISFPCCTNNPAADMLIGNKLGLAESMGIEVCCSLRLPRPCLVRDIDFCIIFSNALDNAIHACKGQKDGAEKYIRVTGHVQGDFILLEIENSFQGTGAFKTGTGLSNVKAVAEKYHGAVSIKAHGASVILSVLLIVPRQPVTESE